MLVWFLLITISSLVAIWSLILAQLFIEDTDLALVHTFAQIGGRVITCCYVYALLFKSLRLGLTHVIRPQGVRPVCKDLISHQNKGRFWTVLHYFFVARSFASS